MRKWAVLDLLLLSVIAAGWRGQVVLRWGAEKVLSYLVGTAVTVGEVEALYWEGEIWTVRLRQVQLASTLPGDSMRAAELAEVTLKGQGIRLDTVRIRGAILRFVRLGKAQKNFRFFPRRSARPRPQRFWVEGDSLYLWLDNIGAGLALSLAAERAGAWVEIDSVSVALRDMQAQLRIQEVCLRENRLPLPTRLKVEIEGQYEKATDSWRTTMLSLRSDSARLHFWGDIFAWERPKGWIHAEVDAATVLAILPEVSAAAGLERVWLSGWINLPAYAVSLWGRWREGAYAVCAEGVGLEAPQLEGRLTWAAQVNLRLYGRPNSLQVAGTWHLRGLRGYGYGVLNLSKRKGSLFLTAPTQDTLWLMGSLAAASGWAKVGTLRPLLAWNRAEGLRIEIDSVHRTEVLAALEPYRPLVGGGSDRGPVHIRCSHLQWDSAVALRSLQLSLGQQLSGTGFLHIAALEAPISLRFGTVATLHRGWVSALGKPGWAFGTWVGDSVSVSAWGRWQDVVVWGSGEGSLSTRQLWLRQLHAEVPGQGQAQIHGKLSVDSANVEVSAGLALPWLWRLLPIEGVELYTGVLQADLCAQGAWDALLRWDNPTEGRVSLTEVSGEFVNVGLSLTDLSARLHYTPEDTWLDTLALSLGEARLGAQGHLQGTLSYLYTDWQRLRGELWVVGRGIALDPLWRQVPQKGTEKEFQRRVRLPEKMEATFGVHLQEVDVYGLHFSEVHGRARVREGSLWADTVAARYAGGLLAGRGFLDGLDTSCYMVASRVFVQGLPLVQVLSDFSEYIPISLRRAGLQGTFSGEAQLGLRFTGEARWQEQSTVWATGYVSKGVMRTPRFLRWLRPYYLAAYRDSMDFLAEVPELSISDGRLSVVDAFLLTRVAAFRVNGYHDLEEDQFLYRFRGSRVYRRAQRYSNLEQLPLYMRDLLDRSLFLVYIERQGSKTRWRYPWRYLLRRLLTSQLFEPATPHRSLPSLLPD